MGRLERRRYRRVPGLTIERANNQGYVAVLERADPADAVETRRARMTRPKTHHGGAVTRRCRVSKRSAEPLP